MAGRTKVLIVDDEVLVRQTVAKILEQEGFEVEVHGGTMGLSLALHRHQPEIVLLDLDLGGRQGEQAIRDAFLACGEALSHRPKIIVVSGLSEEEIAQRGRDLGADATVSKLQPLDEIVAACRRCT